MNKLFLAGLLLTAGTLVVESKPATATSLAKIFANQNFYCKGGNETSGRNYHFKSQSDSIERLDHRFPDKSVVFLLGHAKKGTLGDYWSYETLSESSKDRLMLYERVSMRSPSQNKHVYRTYEFYARGGKMFMTLYDGVSGARDWKIKTTRDCGEISGTKIVNKTGSSYWSTTFSR